MQTGFAKRPAKEILIGATFVMGILYVPYSIWWHILPEEKFRALPWLLLVVVGLAATGWILRRWIHRRREARTAHRKTDQRESPWRLPLPEFLVRPLKEILTQTILCTGAIFAGLAILVPLIPVEPVGVSPLGPVVVLVLVAICWIGGQHSKKRRQSGGGSTGHSPAPRTSFH